MDFNRTWYSNLRYGDSQYCGLQLKHLEIEALTRKISHLRIILFKPHIAQLVLAMFAWYQHVAGIAYSALEQHPFTMPYINSLWLNDLVRLLNKYNVELKLKKTLQTKPQRQNDRHIIDDILTNISSTTSLKKLLACRLHLHITLLSEIADINGASILNNVLIGSRTKNRHQTLAWSLQQKPNIHS